MAQAMEKEVDRGKRISMADVQKKIPDGIYPGHILLQIADGLNAMAARSISHQDFFAIQEETDFRRRGEVKLQSFSISSFECEEEKRRRKALARFDQGAYHICQECNGIIEPERRAAIATATTCIKHNGSNHK